MESFFIQYSKTSSTFKKHPFNYKLLLKKLEDFHVNDVHLDKFDYLW